MCNVCTQTCSCVKPLALGVGKTYLDRKNNKIKIVSQEQNPSDKYYRWIGVNGTSLSWYRDDGGYSLTGTVHHADLVKEYREPAVRYINEYPDGYTGSVYLSREEAIAGRSARAIRTGVKFVEVIEDGTNNA